MTLFIIRINDEMLRDILHNRIIAIKWINRWKSKTIHLYYNVPRYVT